MQTYREAVENGLRAIYASQDGELAAAMRYSLLAGGKRLRGIMTLAFCELSGGSVEDAIPYACAIEMIHAYSLIHDDLPAMDNDTLRRGKPTNHVVYGDAMAILAGDGLLTDAFRLLSQGKNRAAEAVSNTARAAGSCGMVGGQAMDIRAQGRGTDPKEVQMIHRLKTGCLFEASCVNGVLSADGDSTFLNAATIYGRNIGTAFQIVDDLLDLESTPEEMGKSIGKDEREQKMTWPACVGVKQAKEDAALYTEKAVKTLAPFGSAAYFLKTLAETMLQRVN